MSTRFHGDFQVLNSMFYNGIEFGFSKHIYENDYYISWECEDQIHCLNIHEHYSCEAAKKAWLCRVCTAVRDREGLTTDLCDPKHFRRG